MCPVKLNEVVLSPHERCIQEAMAVLQEELWQFIGSLEYERSLIVRLQAVQDTLARFKRKLSAVFDTLDPEDFAAMARKVPNTLNNRSEYLDYMKEVLNFRQLKESIVVYVSRYRCSNPLQ